MGIVVESIAKKIGEGCQRLQLKLSKEQLHKLEAYINLLVKWNRAYNLTAIREPEKMVIYHLLDSLVLKDGFNQQAQNILDVGSGAGVPGIPLSIVFPDKDFTLLDSNGKKTRFMTQAKLELGLNNCNVVKQRVENLIIDCPFDVIISRAFSTLADFVKNTEHLLGELGEFYAMKGKYPEEEIASLPSSACLVRIQPLKVPFLSEQRHLVVLKKSN